MKKIVGIRLENTDTMEYFFVEELEIKKNITVIVKTDRGLQFGRVETNIHPVEEKSLTKKLGEIVRIASKNDYINHKNNIKDAKMALNKINELIKKYNLNMQVLDSFYNFDRSQLFFNFYSEERIDFRNLAKDLANTYKTRIELRQVGVRDKAKKMDGLGCCGQRMCCSRFLSDFDSVSISMAKNQNLSLNPSKINGVCGRLLCCLKYEDENYKCCKKNLPAVGNYVELNEGKGRVISVDILNRIYKVDIPNLGIIEVKLEDECC